MSASDTNYLWDRTGEVDPVVARLEGVLAARRFDPSRRPLVASPRRTGRWVRRVLAAAAVLLVLGGGAAAAYRWRFAWPAGTPWPVTLPGAGGEAVLRVGEPFSHAGETPAVASVARIGWLSIAPDTDLTLAQTSAVRHVIALSRGRIGVRVVAPPFVLVVRTPAGLVIDLGCAFDLEVDPAGTARVSVTSGSIELENPHGATRVPAGARSEMTGSRAPFAPVYADAAPGFEAAVRALERGEAGRDVTVTTLARERDVVTLLVLASRASGDVRAGLVQRAAALSPPPSGVDLADVAAGDDPALWRWYDALPLPPVKQWWRNWRDALP